MYKRKSNGPRFDPWGTPRVIALLTLYSEVYIFFSFQRDKIEISVSGSSYYVQI